MKMTSLLLTLSFVCSSMVKADQLVPLTIMRPTCIRQGKCIDDHGHVDLQKESVFWGSSLHSYCLPLRHRTLNYEWLSCPTERKWQYWQYSTSFSFQIEPDCLCPEGKPCLVGNGDTPLCSTRFWLGHCNPEGSECVPQLQISVREAKTLFPYATPTPDNGLGGPCEIGVGVDCQDFDTALTCSTACLSKVATPLPEFDGDHHLGVVPSPTFLPREVNPLGLGNVDGVCSYIPGSQGVGDCCLCQTDCASGLQCYMVKSGALATLPVPDMSLLEDLSVTGTCLVPPAGAFQPAGAPQCTRDCDCLPGHECTETTAGSGVFLCKKPNGLPCFDNSHCISGMCENPGPNGKCIADIGDRCVATIQCVAPAVCHIPAGWNKGHCLLPNFESCAQDENCVSGVCGDVGGGMVCLALKGEPCYPLASGGIVPNFNCAPGLECSDMVTGVGVCQLP